MLQRGLSGLTLLVLLCHNGVKATELTICENQPTFLSCGVATIKVLSVFYGRDDTTTCASGNTDNTNCALSDALNIAATTCDGTTLCKIIPYETYSDPCFGTSKYMRLSYQCVVPAIQPPPIPTIIT
ncbi:L-rhamnose-binding lectin CSL1-like [Triplophysa rosa]|uniref:L-rhamnose-binding lectin CSL1-like n=1 Tax=Triplophysa rosa TaxID=992332 RepID=UPI00254628BF|nr:L-rhamnose-binding lectin CSL1-like [Triplophysa rosa]